MAFLFCYFTTRFIMPVYTFESRRSIPRLANAKVVADTSYLISLCVDKNRYIRHFHEQAIRHNTDFFINAVVRQELLKRIRKDILMAGITKIATSDPAFMTRYSRLVGGQFSLADLGKYFDRIYKDHVRKDDVDLIIDPAIDIAAELRGFESYARVNYLETNDGDITLDDLAKLIELLGIAPTDGMIAAFAFRIGARAIITMDGDFAQLAEGIDIYMPYPTARQCSVYQSDPDHP